MKKFNLLVCTRYTRPFGRVFAYEFKILESRETDKSLIGLYKRGNLLFIEIFFKRIYIG